MASRREIKLQNQVRFRDEQIAELKNRSNLAWDIIKDIIDNDEISVETVSKLTKAVNILGEHEGV